MIAVSRRRPARLDADTRAVAAKAWEFVQGEIHHAERVLPGPDYCGHVGWRICCQATTFDPHRSSLRTWAACVARHAIVDARRAHNPLGCRRCASHPRLDAPHVGRLDGLLVFLAGPDEITARETADEARRLLGTLTPRERAVMWGVYAEGRGDADVGVRLGISRKKVGRIRRLALARLRGQEGVQDA